MRRCLSGIPVQGAWTPRPPSIERNPLKETSSRPWDKLRTEPIVQPVLEVQRFGPLLETVSIPAMSAGEAIFSGVVSIPGFTQAMDRRGYARHSRLYVEAAAFPPAGFNGALTVSILLVRHFGSPQDLLAGPRRGRLLLGSFDLRDGLPHQGITIDVPFPPTSLIRLALVSDQQAALEVPIALEAYALPQEAYDFGERQRA